MIEVIESSNPESLTEDVIQTVVESSPTTFVVEVTSQGSDILAEVVTTDVVTDVQSQFVVAVELEALVLEVAEQGPPGPAGAATYPGKTLIWSGGYVSEVLIYSDAAKTALVERRVLNRTGSVLNSISYYSGAGVLTKTRTVTYSGPELTSVIDSI